MANGDRPPFPVIKKPDQAASSYAASGVLPSHQLVIGPNYAHTTSRGFGIRLLKQYQSSPKNKASGWILRNHFAGKCQQPNYGIRFPIMLSGAVRYEPERNGRLFRSCKHVLECETLKNNVKLDAYLFWDGMCGTHSKNGWANFSISLTITVGDKQNTLSQMDGISYFGAKNCKGSAKSLGHLIKTRGTPVSLKIQYEMDLAAQSNPMSISEVHLDKPGANFFKIVTR